MSPGDEVAREIENLLIERIVSPASTLLGLDLNETLHERAESRAMALAHQLLDPDRRLAAQTAIDLAALLPDQIPAEWWATPLGLAVGRTYEPTQVVTQAEAARILGTTRAWVGSLVRRGHLATAPGGVTLASVLDRLASQP